MASAIDVLKDVDILDGLAAPQLQAMAELARRQTLHSGQALVMEGDLPSAFYIIEDGELVVSVEPAAGAPDHSPTTIVTLGRGQAVGELALVDGGPRSATVRCQSPVATVLAFDLEPLRRLMESDPSLGYHLMRNLAADLAFKLRQRNIREKMLS